MSQAQKIPAELGKWQIPHSSRQSILLGTVSFGGCIFCCVCAWLLQDSAQLWIVAAFCSGWLFLWPAIGCLGDLRQGTFLTTAWLCAYGLSTEATLERIRYYGGGVGYYGVSEKVFQIEAKGINPLTGEQQLFKQEWSGKESERLAPGDKLAVYVHPTKGRRVYRMVAALHD